MVVGSATGAPCGAALSAGRDNVDTETIVKGIGTLDEELEEKFQKLFVSATRPLNG